MSEELSEESFWKGMAKKYWVAILILGLACVGACIGFFNILSEFKNTDHDECDFIYSQNMEIHRQHTQSGL